jgi:Mn2+/Fe2+ NRAMP family transporter
VTSPAAPELPPLPAALASRNPVRWLGVFGPGAVIASLTIGVGELVFSTRGGALFGYRLLFYFAVVLLMKWVLVFASARHMVLTGAHPFQRWMSLPGPRGWLPWVFFLLAVPCFPIWVCFHAGTLGTLVAGLTSTSEAWHGAAPLGWGLALLLIVLGLCFLGGYGALERIQLLIVLAMLGSVLLALFFIHPDWSQLWHGLLVPQPVHYPDWIKQTHPSIAARPVWLELATYVGIIGGSSYDYLAYVSYLRDKGWGRAGAGIISTDTLKATDAATRASAHRWLRVPLIDCTLSFATVLLFTAVFVICGAKVLGPQQQVPDGSNLLSLQAQFVTAVHPWLRHVYFAGAFLAVFGTLYGTIEVAPTILRELATALNPAAVDKHRANLRRWAIAWSGWGAVLLLIACMVRQIAGGAGQPPALIALLTPANLFTGVLGCGVICLSNVWMERFIPAGQRMSLLLGLLNIGAAVIFTALGFKAYWDHSGYLAFGLLAGTLVAGITGATWFARRGSF